MFYPIISGFSMLPSYLGGRNIECFEQAREVLSMFQQWTQVALNDHHRQQQPLEGYSTMDMESGEAKRGLQREYITSFNILLNILVKIGTIDSAERAQRMLLELSELYDTDTTGTFSPPNMESFNTVLRAWSQAAVLLSRHHRQHAEDEQEASSSTYCAEKAEELLRFLQTLHLTSATTSRHTSLLQPNQTTYNIVMGSWASIGNVERVEALFHEMERAATGIDKPSSYSPTTSTLHPNRKSFKAVIDAYTNSKGDKYKKVAHIAAMNMLRCLEDLHEKCFPDVRPNTFVLNDVIHCLLLADVDDAPMQIDALIAQMEQLVLQDSSARYIQPNTHTYTMALSAWTRYSQRLDQRNTHRNVIPPLEASQRAEHHLRQLVQLVLHDSTQSNSSRKNSKNTATQNEKSTNLLSANQFNTVLSLYRLCCSKNSGSSGNNNPDIFIPQKADEILALMQQCSMPGMPMTEQTLQTYNYIFDIWAHSQHPDRGRRCEELLLRIEQMMQQISTFVPQLYYKRTIDALLSSSTATIDSNNNNSGIGYSDAVWRAEAVLQRMVDQSYHTTNRKQRKELYSCYVSVATALHKLKTAKATDKAKDLFEDVVSRILARLKTLQDKGQPITSDFIVHSTELLMSTLASAQRNNTAEMAKQILLKVDELSRIHADSERPDSIMVNTVLKVCAKCELEGAQKAQALLEELEKREENDSSGVSFLNNTSYSTVMNAWGGSSDRDAPTLVLEVLNKIERRWYQRTNPSLKPDFHVYRCAIDSILDSPSHNSPKVAHVAFDRMINAEISPHPELAAKLIEALCSSGESERAEEVLKANESVMVKMPSEKYYDGKHTTSLTRCLESILNCYLQKNSIAATDRAEKVMRRILSLCDERIPRTTPKTACIDAVLNALLVHDVDYGAQRAYDILRRVMEVKKRKGVIISPSKPLYDKVLHHLINSKANKAGRLSKIGEMADWILENIEDPDQHSYSLGVLAWSYSRNRDKGLRAQQLFDRMCQSCTFIPEPHVYQNLLDAWANDSSNEKAERANLVLSDLVDRCNSGDCTFNPTVNHINAVLQACVQTPSTGNSHVALRVAMAVFREFHNMPSAQPNEETFQMMFTVCKRFVEDHEKKDKLSEKLFREACVGGVLTQGLLESFWDVSSHGLRKRCLGVFQTDPSSHLLVSNFPDEWQCKANQRTNVISLK
jgi:pentatricopeptide repeat protein